MNKKLSTEELEKIKSIQQEYSSLTTKLGEIELKITDYLDAVEELKVEKQSVKKQVSSLREKDQQFTTELYEKYGSGQINIETGEITDN